MDYQSGTSPSVVEEEVIDLREYLQILNKWKVFIILGIVLCGVIVGVWSKLVLHPIYEAKTLLLVTEASSDLVQPAYDQSGENLDQVMGSLTRQPVLTMNTYLGQLQSDVVRQRMYEDLGLDYIDYTPGKISAEIVPDSNLIEIYVQNRDPKLAAAIANSLSQQFLQLLSEKNEQQMARSVDFLKEQSQTTNEKLQAAVGGMREFQQRPRRVAVLDEEFNKKSEAMAKVEADLDLARVGAEQLQAGIDQLENDIQTITPTVPTENIGSATGGPNPSYESNPLYVSAVQQLSQKKTALAEKKAEINGLELLLRKNRMELDALHAELADKLLEQDKLQRDVDLLKATSETLTKKTTETQISKSIKMGDTSVVVVSKAAVPDTPVGPDSKRNIALAVLVGLMVFSLLAFILEKMDNTIKTPEDVANMVGLPTLGVIPVNKNNEKSEYGG